MALQLLKKFRRREITTFLRANPAVSPSEPPLKLPNPFLPRKNPETGRWAPARYSLRRQSDIVNSARKLNMIHLLPPGPKLPISEVAAALQARQGLPPVTVDVTRNRRELWLQQVVWEGEVKEKKVAGAEIGNKLYAGKWRMFKGHKWERTRAERLKKRAFLMKGMKDRIQRFKTIYHRRRPSPLARPKTTAKAKLPF